jgi:hypothetical protein
MENWLLLVEVNCKDAKRLTEFDEWYDTVHIPDIITGSPGFRSATRYVIKHPAAGRGTYLAIYEIETADIEKTMEAHKKNLEEKYGKGRSSDLLEIVSRKLCKVS